jgi:hypothetical protein
VSEFIIILKFYYLLIKKHLFKFRVTNQEFYNLYLETLKEGVEK